MIPYILVFCWCFIFIGIRQRADIAKLLWLIIALLPLLLLAAFRDIDIGTDTRTYLLMLDRYNNLAGVWKFNIEPLYALVNIISNKFANSKVALLFFTESLVVIPIYLSAIKMKDSLSITFVLFIFCTTLYNLSFNSVRQSIAISFACLSIPYLLEKKYFKHYSLCLIAIGFHYTAIIFLIISLLFFLSEKYPISKYQASYLIFFIIFIILTTQLPAVFNLLSKRFPFLMRYSSYVYNVKGYKTNVGYSALVVKLFIAISIMMSYHYAKSNNQKKMLDFFLLCALFDIVLNFTGMFTTYLARIAWYTFIVSFISIPYCYKIRGGRIKLLDFFTIVLFVAYWLYIYVIVGSSQTCPYKSTILGI